MAYYSETNSMNGRVFNKMVHVLKHLSARYKHYRVYRDSLNELQGLSDRDLSDIGINRLILKSISLEAADKKVAL